MSKPAWLMMGKAAAACTGACSTDNSGDGGVRSDLLSGGLAALSAAERIFANEFNIVVEHLPSVGKRDLNASENIVTQKSSWARYAQHVPYTNRLVGGDLDTADSVGSIRLLPVRHCFRRPVLQARHKLITPAN